MRTPFSLVPGGGVGSAPRPRPASAYSVERENLRFLESALAALAGTVRASRVQTLTDLADLERRTVDALALAARVRHHLETGGLESPASRVSAEQDLAGIGSLLRGRAAGAHRSILVSAADTVESAFDVASFAAGRHLSADLYPGSLGSCVREPRR